LKEDDTMSDNTAETSSVRLSYKFQRLRERLRQAIVSGELSGKLPGERTLAKRFNANAKTLSKALTDLAGEGLLDRSIGRGTFVRGSAPQTSKAGRWLVLCDPGQQNSAAVQRLVRENPETDVACDVAQMRPSFINQLSAVIDLSTTAPEAFVRDLLVRNIPVVAVGHEPRTYSVRSVLMDRSLGLSKVARELLAAGHRHFAAVEARGSTIVSESLRHAAASYAPQSSVDVFLPGEVAHVIDSGISSIVCDSVVTAESVMDSLRRQNIPVPGRLSVAAVGMTWGTCPCSGYFVTPEQAIDAALGLLRDQSHRPVSLWLAGTLIGLGTMGPSDAKTPEVELPSRIASFAV
jgi:DNA-binding transcriptional regulator YhcF (GntR family)